MSLVRINLAGSSTQLHETWSEQQTLANSWASSYVDFTVNEK
jgi:hypothetical protein